MALYAAPRLLPAGDGAVSVELDDEISREANARALTLERLLLAARLPGLVDTVPTFRALLVHYDPLVLPWATLRARLLELSGRLADAPPPPGRRVELPCAYGGEHGPDLEDVARRLGLAPGGGRGAPCGGGALRLLRRLHAGPPVHGGAARAADDPAARPAPDQDARRAASRSAGRRPPSTRWRAPAASGCWAGPRCASTTPARPTPILLRAGDHVRFRPIEPAEYAASRRPSRRGATTPGSRPTREPSPARERSR